VRRGGWTTATAIAFATATAVDLGAARAWCRTTTSETKPAQPTDCVTEGMPLFWQRRCQSYSLDTSAGGGLTLAQVRTVVAASFAPWNAVDCGNGPILSITEGMTVTCDHAEYSSNDGNSNTVAFGSDFAAHMYPTDAIALTIVWHDTRTGQIYDVDTIVNEAMGPFVVCPSSGCAPTTSRFDLQNVLTHEAGHFLGLSHTADPNATMFYRADPGETLKRTLEPDDEAGICAAYGGNTLPAECDSTPRHGFDADCAGELPPAMQSQPRDRCGCSTPGRATHPPMLLVSLAAFVAATFSRRRRIRGS